MIVEEALAHYRKMPRDSHKGQNGRLLVIGGSKLFHASIFWAADVASKIVDLVHFTSPAMENNDLVRQKVKAGFWSGIVIPFEQIDEYIAEDDCIVIGPGMPREEGLMEGEEATATIVNRLVSKHQSKKWVIDGGALQEIDPTLLTNSHIITPHQGEWQRLLHKEKDELQADGEREMVLEYSKRHQGVAVVLKGARDVVGNEIGVVKIEGGNEGMTKGGTGDVLAGLIGALYCTNEPMVAAILGSYINKKAGEALYEDKGPYFSAGDLVNQVPTSMAEILGYSA